MAAMKDREHAATVLAVHFKIWFEARRKGEQPPDPDKLDIESADQVADSFGWLAGELGVTTAAYRQALIAWLGIMAEMLSEQGAEIEAVMHSALHPEDPAPKAMVMRLKRPTRA